MQPSHGGNVTHQPQNTIINFSFFLRSSILNLNLIINKPQQSESKNAD